MLCGPCSLCYITHCYQCSESSQSHCTNKYLCTNKTIYIHWNTNATEFSCTMKHHSVFNFPLKNPKTILACWSDKNKQQAGLACVSYSVHFFSGRLHEFSTTFNLSLFKVKNYGKDNPIHFFWVSFYSLLKCSLPDGKGYTRQTWSLKVYQGELGAVFGKYWAGIICSYNCPSTKNLLQ